MSDSFPEDAIEVARIAGAWGVKGWIKVQPYADDPQALFSTKRWYLKPPEVQVGGVPLRPQREAVAQFPTLLKVTQAKEHGDGVVAGVQDVLDRSAAEALRGARIFVARSSFPTAGEDEFYWVDLIGLRVINAAGVVLGQVSGLLETGAHCVLRVQPEAEDVLQAGAAPTASASTASLPEERLIPFVAAYVQRVDLAGRLIQVDWELDY